MGFFDVRAVRDGDRVRVRASGEVDLATAPRLAACVHEQVDGRTGMVEVDLTEVGFIDSTGVRALMAFDEQARAEGWRLEVVPSDAVRRVVCLLGLQCRLLSSHEAVEPRAAMRA